MTISRIRWEYFPLVCTGLLTSLGGIAIAQAQAPTPVVVATDQEDKAIVDAVVQEIQRQGGSIVPPMEETPKAEQDESPVREILKNRRMRPDNHRHDEIIDYMRRQRQRAQERQEHDQIQVRLPNNPKLSKANLLRDSSWHLEEVAHRLEVEGLYGEADAIRGTARMLREKSRELARSEESKPNKSDDPRERTLGAVQ